MRLELLPAPDQVVSQTGDPKALRGAFECSFMCGHVEAAHVWIPIGVLANSRDLEEVMAASADELCSRALVNRCRSCTRLLAS